MSTSSEEKPATGLPDVPVASQLRLIGGSVLIGIAAAIGASLFLWLIEEGQMWLFSHLPSSLGIEPTAWWWISLILLTGAVCVVLARLMMGKTGDGPLTGFHFHNPLHWVPGILFAATASLLSGISLGPEAPLIVLGSAIGGLLVIKGKDTTRKAFGFIGGAAAIGAVFGSPLISGFMILEFVALGLAPASLIIPVFVALSSSYLVQLGIWSIPGFGVHSLSVPGLPDYPNVQVGDIGIAILVAALAAVVALLARRLGQRIDSWAHSAPMLWPFIGAAVTATVTVIGVSLVGVDPKQILFSGNAGMSGLIAETSLLVVVFILVAKAIVYAIALGSGFRGGPIFPATFLGVAIGVMIHLLIPGDNVSALAAAGIAASAAAFTKLPGTSALLAAILIFGTGPAIAPFAILGSVVGMIVRISLERRNDTLKLG